MKPISTLMRPLDTVNLSTCEPAKAQSERSDVTAVPALGVIAEAVVGMTLETTTEELFRAIHPHPTLSEAVMEAAENLHGESIHI